jgi:inner membrane protein
VDPLTHGVASFALQRAFFPKAKFAATVAIILGGLLADLDRLTYLFGPSAYLAWHRTATHSVSGAIVIALVGVSLPFAALSLFGISGWGGSVIPVARGPAPRVSEDEPWGIRHGGKAFFSVILSATFVSALLHLLLDLCQSDGVALLWPFSPRRFALDALPPLEPWLLTILLAAILLPELFLLVNEEIGARAKRPRGRNGAIVGLLFAALYIGLRVLLHANAVASLEAHTMAGEMPHRAAAFPDTTSPFLWHSVVETQSALNLVTMRSMGNEASYASGVTTLHKPEPSPMLAAAQDSPAAVSFVKFARFPKAVVQTEFEGYSVEIQDLKDQATEEQSHAIFADISLDKNFRVISSELQWQKNSPGAR